MPPPHRRLLRLLSATFLLIHLCATPAAPQQHPDLQPLLDFKSSLTPSSSSSAILSGWNTTSSTSPCSWPHVTCLHGRVSRLLLHDLLLSSAAGSPLFPLLSSLPKLRLLSLSNNSFSGPILFPSSNLSLTLPLRLLFLSRNCFSGPFPSLLLPLLPRLLRLDLSHNLLSGPLPLSLLPFPPSLLTLRLELNNFSGLLPPLSLPSLRDFNVSANSLSGPIPRQLSPFPSSSFSGNPGLCGAPLSACARFSSDPTRPGPYVPPPMSKPESVIASSPSSMPTGVADPGNPRRSASARMKPFALITIIVGDFIVLAVISLILYCYFWKSHAEKMGEGRKGAAASKVLAGEKIVYSTSPYPANPPGGSSSGCDRGKMVFLDLGARRFELEDLLRASAEMLGKGGMGTAYKAVLEDGGVVAVKRLRDVGNGGMGRREVEERMEVLGGLRHGNVVGLRAYYFSREEKLLVYDYMPNGSLFWLLHGKFSTFCFDLHPLLHPVCVVILEIGQLGLFVISSIRD